MKCWYCEKDIVFSGGELTKHCPECGVENDRQPYTMGESPKKEELLTKTTEQEWINKEEIMIPETKKGTSSFAPWLFDKSSNIQPEAGAVITIKNEWSASENPKITYFLLGECEFNGQIYTHGINATSYYGIAKVLGKDTKDWVGRQLEYKGKVKMGTRGAIGHLWTAKE